MRVLRRHYNDIQLVLGGVSLMILTCLVLAVPPQAGAAGRNVFVVAVFMMYAIGYPIGHTAVSSHVRSSLCVLLSRSLFVHVFTARDNHGLLRTMPLVLFVFGTIDRTA